MLIVIVLFIVSGCYPKDEEQEQKGSVNAVSLCIKKNEQQSELVSKKLIKNQCISKHEQFKAFIWEKGKHQARVTVLKDKINVDITKLTNNLPSFVITSVNIGGQIRGPDGIEIRVSEWISDLWIEPNSVAKTFVSLPIENKNEKNIDVSCGSLEEKRNCQSWTINGYRGLEVKLK